VKAHACSIFFRLFDGSGRLRLASPAVFTSKLFFLSLVLMFLPSIRFFSVTQFRAAFASPLGRVMRRRVRQFFSEESSHVFVA